MNERDVLRHSINCIRCGELADERECIRAKDGEGEICPKCFNPKTDEVE